ncbi:MAG: LamG domain-containing protein, partial [Planctomycetes bacterium]|nr:LamG domain-containing protein [Planctomycetota bacterium]
RKVEGSSVAPAAAEGGGGEGVNAVPRASSAAPAAAVDEGAAPSARAAPRASIAAAAGSAGEVLAPWLLVDLEGADGRRLRLCDFATAGCLGTRYRSWLPAVGAPPPRVLLDAPRRGQSLGPGRVLFRWTGLRSEHGAEAFVLHVSPREDFSEIALLEEIARSVAVPSFEFAAGREYFWKVVSRNAAGEIESETRSFRIDPDGEPLARGEIEAMIPAPDGLLLAAPLRGSPEPSRGLLQDARAIRPAAGRRGEESGAVLSDGKTGRIRYATPLFPAGEYTASVWVRIESLPEGRLAQIASAWAGGMDDPLRICVEDGKLFARIEAGSAYSTQGAPVETGRWFHVAAVKEGAELRLYIGGERKAKARVPPLLATAARNIALGANPNFSGDEHLEAAFADFRLHARALSDEEVAAAAAR